MFKLIENRLGLLQAVVLIAVSIACVILAWNLPWPELKLALIQAHPGWLALALAANAAVYPLWIWQWRLLASVQTTVPWRAMAEIVALSSLTNNTLFKAAGIASSGLLLVSRGKLDTGGASTVMLLDQLLVGIVKILLIALVIALVPLPQQALVGAAAFGTLIGALALIVLALLLAPHALHRLADRSRGWVRAAALWLLGVSRSLQSLRKPQTIILALTLAIGKKAAEILAAYAVQAACGLDASLLTAVLVVAAIGITTAVPIVPGSFGIYSATVFAVYQFVGRPVASGVAAGLLQHLVELLPALILGFGAVILARRKTARQASP